MKHILALLFVMSLLSVSFLSCGLPGTGKDAENPKNSPPPKQAMNIGSPQAGDAKHHEPGEAVTVNGEVRIQIYFKGFEKLRVLIQDGRGTYVYNEWHENDVVREEGQGLVASYKYKPGKEYTLTVVNERHTPEFKKCSASLRFTPSGSDTFKALGCALEGPL